MTEHPTHVLFLHGYTTPVEPTRETLTRALRSVDLAAELHTPLAPDGDVRRDPFNPAGDSSWFRYATDRSDCVPQGIDYANLSDVHDVMYSSWESHGLVHQSLWDQLTLIADNGAKTVALIGESQGGVMAALLGIEWNRQNPHNQLGWIGLVRTAPDPHTWQPRAADESGTFTFHDPWNVLPPRYETRFCVVLGADDTTYRTYTSIGALGPLLINNQISNRGIGIHHAPDGNVDLHILPGVTHDSHEDSVFATVAASLARG
jgi:hypothetical protein